MRDAFEGVSSVLPWTVDEFTESGDVILVYCALAITNLVQWFSTSIPLRAAVGLPLILAFPGYAVLLFLFPRRPDGDDDADGAAPGSLGHLERVALSFGISLTLAPLVALGFALIDIPLTQLSVTTGFTGLTAIFLSLGQSRRRQLPAAERFVVPFDRWLAALGNGVGGLRRSSDDLLNAALVLAVVFALASLGFGLLVPTTGEQYTNFYLVTENGDGEFVAADYPVDGTGGELTVGIDNHERRAVEYHVVAQLQRVSTGEAGDGPVRVLERQRLHGFTVTLNDSATRLVTHTVELPAEARNASGSGNGSASANERLRLVYLLYLGGVPAEPSMDDAHRSLYLWLETTPAPDTSAAADAAERLDRPATSADLDGPRPPADRRAPEG